MVILSDLLCTQPFCLPALQIAYPLKWLVQEMPDWFFRHGIFQCGTCQLNDFTLKLWCLIAAANDNYPLIVPGNGDVLFPVTGLGSILCFYCYLSLGTMSGGDGKSSKTMNQSLDYSGWKGMVAETCRCFHSFILQNLTKYLLGTTPLRFTGAIALVSNVKTFIAVHGE